MTNNSRSEQPEPYQQNLIAALKAVDVNAERTKQEIINHARLSGVRIPQPVEPTNEGKDV